MRTVQTAGAVQKPSQPPRSRAQRPNTNWSGWYESRREAVNEALAGHLREVKEGKAAGRSHTRVINAVEYSLLQPGKRLRPILVLEACRVCAGRDAAAWPAAIAVECIHAFSLIHDDLPAMDDDDLRRGAPTCHKIFGDALAILAGDWLVAHAFELAASDRDSAASLVRTLARGTQAMVVGQGSDIEGESSPTSPDRVRFIHRHKTAALIEASATMGAHAAGAEAESVEAMAQFGRHLGLAFQIYDDLLDATASTADLGKRAGKDATASKQTYPAAFGLEESRKQAKSEIDAATAALTRFGEPAANLRGLAQYVIERKA